MHIYCINRYLFVVARYLINIWLVVFVSSHNALFRPRSTSRYKATVSVLGESVSLQLRFGMNDRDFLRFYPSIRINEVTT